MTCLSQGPGDTFYITAVEIVLTYASGGAATVTYAESVAFADTYSVSGSGTSAQTKTFSESVAFADTYSIVSRSSDDITTGRVDVACRACGTFVQYREDKILYADGLGAPLTWDGVSASMTTLSGGVKSLAFPVAHRNRIFLFGDEPYVTGTVTTTAGVTTITTSASWPSTTLGKAVAIENANFGSGGTKCFTVVNNVNGTIVTLADAPDATLVAANFIVFGGTAAAGLQWSADGDETSWPDAVLPVGRLDGDIPTGAASLNYFILLFKRQSTYRFDYDFDPNDPNDRALNRIAETRGLVANRSCVVVEGSAYCMDRFGSGGGEAGFWTTRGGYPLDIGRPISPLTASGADYELDWNKSSCWFGVFEPQSNSIWWFATKDGDNLPKIAFVYMRPNIEGGDEPGRWCVHEFDHPVVGGVTAVGSDGALRAYVLCADPDNESTLYLAAVSNEFGDMAKSAQNGTVVKKVSNTVIDLGLHTALRKGSRVEINGVTRTVSSDTGTEVTFTSSWGTTEVVGKTWKAGWKKRVRFKTILISPEPAFSVTTVQQVHALLSLQNRTTAELRLGVEADRNTEWLPVLGGAGTGNADFRNDEVLVSMQLGQKGYAISLIFDLYSPGGDDFVRAVEIIRAKQNEPTIGLPSGDF